MKKLVVLLVGLILISCGPQEEIIKKTNSGFPEAVFEKTTVSEVKSKIIEEAEKHGMYVIDSDNDFVLLGAKLKGGDAFIGQLVVGTRYGSPPENRTRFQIYERSDKTIKVSAREWIESQNGFGGINRSELSANHQKNSMQKFLWKLGGK